MRRGRRRRRKGEGVVRGWRKGEGVVSVRMGCLGCRFGGGRDMRGKELVARVGEGGKSISG